MRPTRWARCTAPRDWPHRDCEERVGPCVYVRLHGAGGTCTGAYPEHRLEGWSDWLKEQQLAGAEVYAYFNNDIGGHAPRDAVTLRRLLEDK